MLDSALTTFLHECGGLVQGARPVLLVCVAPGKEAAPATLASLKFAQCAMASRLLPPEPVTPRGLQGLVAQLRRQLAHVSAASATGSALQAAERKRFDDEVAALRAQEASRAQELEAAQQRAEEAERLLAEERQAAKTDGGGSGNGLHAEFAREARVLGLLYRQARPRATRSRGAPRTIRPHLRTLSPRHHYGPPSPYS